jgi:hypothetical protein
MYYFDCLPIHDIVAVFFHYWIVCVPFFEVDVNIIVTHRLCVSGGGGGGGGGSFPFWKNKFFRFDDNFINVA